MTPTIEASSSIGLENLIDKLKEMTFKPKRDPNGPFIFSVDHCFLIKGQGTVMTGTVLSGSVQVNTVMITILLHSVISEGTYINKRKAIFNLKRLALIHICEYHNLLSCSHP